MAKKDKSEYIIQAVDHAFLIYWNSSRETWMSLVLPNSASG